MKNITKKIFQTFGVIVLTASTFATSLVNVASATSDVCTAPVDVVLVFDRSDSMTYDGHNPIQPLTDAQQGTLAFINTLSTSNDRVGLVDFAEYAVLTNSLTTDFASVRLNVEENWTDSWTNTGSAIEKARQELNDNGRDGVKHAIIVLSDGNPTKPVSDEVAIANAIQKADDAKNDGIAIYAIGFGDGVNPDFLRSIASDPANYYFSPTSDGIMSAYMSLAQTVCQDENTKPVITLAHTSITLTVGDVFDPLSGHATANDAEDGNLTDDLSVGGAVDTATEGVYTVTYNVQDSQGLSAEPQTLIVIVKERETITLIATKIVCDDESYLPNWGGETVAPITEATVANFLADVNDEKEVCRVVPNYQFQWAPEGTLNAGDNYGLYDAPWTTFTSSVQIDLAGPSGKNSVWVREAWSNVYIPFTGVSTTLDESAEIYCHVDTVNYDNYDRVDGPLVSGTTYYCVAFNTVVEVPPQCSDRSDNDGDALIDADDIGCWTDPTDPKTYDPNDNDEKNEVNTAPVILGADQPLLIYVGETGNLDTLARLGVTATDTEDGVITSGIVITDLNTISTSTIGTTTIYYNVLDSKNLPAPTVPRLVKTVTQCSDGIDNDGDQTIDMLDSGCASPEDNSEGDNTKPVITLAQATLNLTVGATFNPLSGHATANDAEDGDITANLVATSTVNTAVAGTYTVEYGVQDSKGLAADPKTLTVVVSTPTVVHGGGGGGGYYAPMFNLSNEKVVYLGNGKALVTWTTNQSATSRVVYGDNSIVVTASAPLYGYDMTNTKDANLVTSHSMTIEGLTDSVSYYFRPISGNTSNADKLGIELTYTFQTISVPGQCNYLLEYIKLGEVNNPVEVEKLERFLNLFEGEALAVNGVYEQADFEAVERFQNKYFSDILGPWGHTAPTGYVYITTKKKINEIFCQREFALDVEQSTEIASFRTFLAGLETADVGVTTGGADTTEDTTTVDVGDLVGQGDVIASSTLAETGDTTEEGLFARIQRMFGFGKATDTEGEILADAPATTTASSTNAVEPTKNLATVILSGVVGVATSYWFIFLLIVFATILFLRIRSAEKE